MLFLLILSLFTPRSEAQSVTEKVLREAPRLSWSMIGSYSSNLQERGSYQNQQGSVLYVSPRYRLSDKYTLIGLVGVQQAMSDANLNWQNRSDFTNATVGISRTPMPIGKLGDLRLTATAILPTNQFQREHTTYNGGVRGTANFFVRSNSNLVWDLNTSAVVNNHTYSVDFNGTGNINYSITPFQDIGWVFFKYWQVVAYQAYTAAWDYRGERRGMFVLDESITYAKSRKWNVAIGTTNAGSILTRDGQATNVSFYDTRTQTVYIQGNIIL